MELDIKIIQSDIREPVILASKLYTRPIVAEIGVDRGNHAWAMYNILDPERLYLIDFWLHNDKLHQKVHDRFKKYENIYIYQMTSKEAVTNWFREDYFNFLYIDANHNYEAVKEDLELWWPKVKKYGILSGHDWNKPKAGVEQAVREFSDKINLKFDICKNKRNFWFIK